MNELILKAIALNPSVIDYLSLPNRLQARKAAPIPRDELERKLARAIYAVDKRYLEVITQNNGQIPFDFWVSYQKDLSDIIASPIRAQIEQSFTEQDNAQIVDSGEANSRVDAAVTAAIIATALLITNNTRNNYNTLLSEGATGSELIDRIGLRFSSGHAEQVAVTELTRAEGQFGNVLSDMLSELGLNTQIRLTTAVDERVCPICGPADHKLKTQPINTATGGWNGQTWGDRFGNVPFHINCRCKTRVETR